VEVVEDEALLVLKVTLLGQEQVDLVQVRILRGHQQLAQV
jgi:hypothetical protein